MVQDQFEHAYAILYAPTLDQTMGNIEDGSAKLDIWQYLRIERYTDA